MAQAPSGRAPAPARNDTPPSGVDPDLVEGSVGPKEGVLPEDPETGEAVVPKPPGELVKNAAGDVFMVFPHEVRLRVESTVHRFEAGTHPVPAELVDHWYLRDHGVVPLGQK
jgi:hypothetical protein